MADALKELEESARILLASPHQVHSSQRQLAESVFINFRRSKTPFALCRHILENSTVEYVIFQAAAVLKETIIREWRIISRAEIESLRNYLLQYVSERSSLPSYVREQIFQVLAIIVKRSGVDGETTDKEYVLNEVSVLINGGNQFTQSVGCSILSALLNEYASTIKSSDVGLTWEIHFQAKKAFEATDLKRIFQFCLQVLNELEKCSTPSHDYLNLLNRFLTIAEQILSWNFIYNNLPKKLIGIFESDQSPSLRPGVTWRDVLLDQTVLDLFFKIHWKIRENCEISHHSVNCLVQLASLHGTIFSDREARIHYLSHFLQGLLKLMTNTSIDHEALGVANIISKLMLFFPPPVLILTSRDLIDTFMKQLGIMTCSFAQQAVQEEVLQKDDKYFSEAFDSMLEAWVTIFHDYQVFPEDQCITAAISIINTYIQCHLSTPEGIRNQFNVQNETDEIDETEEDDRIKYRDQLSVIGMLGRHCLNHVIPLLSRLLEDRIRILRSHLESLQLQVISANESKILHNLYEDLHWLILIIGHLLTVDNEGEPALVPLEIMQFSINQRSSCNIELTLKLLTSNDIESMNNSNLTQHCDQIIRLVALLFRLVEMEQCALKANMMHLLSPEVSSTLLWFFKRWTLAYLLPNESYYSEISPAINSAFGHDSQTGIWCINFLLNYIDINFTAWITESQVIVNTIQLFLALVENKDRGSKVAVCEGLSILIRKQTQQNFSLLPSAAKRGLLKALVLAGNVVSDTPTREQYWLEVLKPLQIRFKELICQENFARSFHEERIKNEMLHLLDCFIGIVQGCEIYNIQYLFSFIHPIISELTSVLNIYHNYQDMVEQILECFCECTRRMLCYLNQSESRRLYETCLLMIQTFANNNLGKQNSEATAEEEQYQDLLLLMELLTNLLSKDFIDFSPSTNPEEEAGHSAADVTLYGLNIIMPLITLELLKFPQFCLQYFKMITFVCEIYPEKVCQLPDQLVKNLLSSIELGLHNFGSDITMLCLDFLTVLGSYIFKVNLHNGTVYEGTRPFLKMIFEMLLLQNFDSDLLYPASSTLFSLICCYQDNYQELVENLLQKQTEPVYYERLYKAFNSLMSGIQFVEDRSNRIKFRDNFEKFFAEVRGFLCIK